jgi:hypothetical protein
MYIHIYVYKHLLSEGLGLTGVLPSLIKEAPLTVIPPIYVYVYIYIYIYIYVYIYVIIYICIYIYIYM